MYLLTASGFFIVALRKESVDRNRRYFLAYSRLFVALRKESVDRNIVYTSVCFVCMGSLSARRAWIEISALLAIHTKSRVALRKESVDRNV